MAPELASFIITGTKSFTRIIYSVCLMTSLCGAHNLLGGTAVFTFLMEMSGGIHTHVQTHVLYTQGFQCTADSCVVCMWTTHVIFLSIICHTYCTVIVLLSAFIPVCIFIFANMTHNVCNCVLGGSQLCQCVYLCVSYNVQYVCPSCGHFTAVLNFRSALSQLSKCLPWIFLTPIFYRNHCYKF